MRKIKNVLRLKFQLHLSDRQIARSCALARSTVAEYVRRAQGAGLSWPLPEGWDDRAIQNRVFPPTGKSPPEQRPLPDFATVHEERCRHKHVTLMLLWDEYKQAYPEGYQYSQFCDLYHRWRGKLDLVLRQEHRAGEKLFVDYAGDTVPIVDRHTGETQEASIFVAVLGASNYTYAEASLRQDLPSWLAAHTRALEFLGGCPCVVVPDNTKDAVHRPCRYEPDLNRTLQVERTREAEGLSEPLYLAIVYGPQDRISVYRQGKLYASYFPKGEGPESKLQIFREGKDRVRFGRLEGGGQIDEARLYGRALTAEEIQRSFRAGIHNLTRSEVLRELSAGERRQRDSLLEELERRRADLEKVPPIPQVYAVNPLQPASTFIQNRGDPAKPGERVLPGGLSALSSLSPEFGMGENAPEAQRRLRLAEWILDPDNPLTARVLVNRVWQYHFGRGIVGTPNDFGFNGERPTHPELLDWLARWFMDHGWSFKALHREIMLSSSYRQSSRFREASAERDPENRLLWRFSPRRLEAEVIRDALLATSGELNRERGGPGFRPFEVRVFNTHFYDLIDSDEAEMKRRTVYRIVVRSGGDPLLEAFDCPDSAFKAPRRGITTTPLQSLTLMNNSFVMRQADRLAQRIAGDAKDGLPAQVDRAYRLTLGRAPQAGEARRALTHVQSHGLESLCWALFNSSEFLYLN